MSVSDRLVLTRQRHLKWRVLDKLELVLMIVCGICLLGFSLSVTLDIVKDGGRVTSDFFAPLQEGLGEWYDDVVNIALAYQDVYALTNQISLEKQRLDLIKEQRKELDAQNQARQDAFLHAGEFLCIPPHKPHSAVALEDTVGIDFFTPPRQDWLDKTDDYLRR